MAAAVRSHHVLQSPGQGGSRALKVAQSLATFSQIPYTSGREQSEAWETGGIPVSRRTFMTRDHEVQNAGTQVRITTQTRKSNCGDHIASTFP